MKIVNCTKYGPPEVLKIVNIEKPIPKDDEILIKNYATTVTIADCRVRGFNIPVSFWLPAKVALGFFRPKKFILGAELSGVIESIGKNVTKFKIGDSVFAFTGHEFGGYAEYVCIKENSTVALNPENLNFEESATLSFGGTTALHFLKKGNTRRDDKVLVYGASGSVGTYAVQLLKYFGAEVTGVCSSENLELVKRIGADKVIDYKSSLWTNFSEKFDVFFDTVGKCSIPKAISMVKPQGRYIYTLAPPYTDMKIRYNLLNTKIKFTGGSFNATVEQMNFIRKLAIEGYIKPVIDRYFNFDDIVLAHEYVDKGHKKGNVVVKL
jgi:NADPH:quinone reductase-like Zn-dependent oxidoreductase